MGRCQRSSSSQRSRNDGQPDLFYADHPRLPFHRCTTKRSFCNQTRWVKLDADFPPSGSSLQAFPYLSGLRLFLVAMAGDQGFARAFEQGPTRLLYVGKSGSRAERNGKGP